MEFLKISKIKVLDWPGNSSDLNLIENCRFVLKDKGPDEQPVSSKALEDTIKEI